MNASAGCAQYLIKLIKLFFSLSVQEKEENVKTVEDLLEKGLIEMANKEEELQVFIFLLCCIAHI